MHIQCIYMHIYNFCMKDIWEHVSVHYWQGKFQLWANCFMCLIPVANCGPRSLRDTSSTTTAPSVLSTQPESIRQKDRNELCYITNPGQHWALAETSLPWAAYTWHWRISIIFVWSNYYKWSPCTGCRVNFHQERIASYHTFMYIRYPLINDDKG